MSNSGRFKIMRMPYIDWFNVFFGGMFILLICLFVYVFVNTRTTMSVFRNAGYNPTNLVNHRSVKANILKVCGQDTPGHGVITFLASDSGDTMVGSRTDGEILWVCKDDRLSSLLKEEIRLDVQDSDDTLIVINQVPLMF